jgi:chaperonin GroEL
MTTKLVHFANDSRLAMLRGIDVLADAVGATLGPRGRTVLLDRRYGPPVVTRDGYTVANDIDLDGKLANMGARLVKEVALLTTGAAGDGTSTVTLLARTIFAEGIRLVTAGHDPMSLKRGVDKGVTALLGALRKLSRPIRDGELSHVATISANGDPEVGSAVSQALGRVGKEGVVSVENGRGLDTKVEFVEGVQIDHGWTTPMFVTDPVRMEAVLENALVFLYDGRLTELRHILPILGLAQRAKRPLVVMADATEGVALQTLVVNKQKGVLGAVAIKGPATNDQRREVFADVAAVVGARVFAPELGLPIEQVKVEDLGRVRQVVIERDSTMFIDGGGERRDVEARAAHIRNQIRRVDRAAQERLQDRLAALLGGVAIVRVGGTTEIDVNERKSRFDDSICATRAAMEEGVVPGGGVALIRIAAALDDLEMPEDERPAATILRRALEEPARWLAANSGAEPSVVLDRIRTGKRALGWNAATLEFEDLEKAGVIDATKVLRIALLNAASMAGLLLTTEAAIADSPIQWEKTYLDPPRMDPNNMKPRSGRLKI